MSNRRRPRLPGIGISIVLLAVLVMVNAVAVWGILAARRAARETAVAELELRTRADAASLEALLASLRADLGFLARSPPLAGYAVTRASDDPLVRRWGRIDVEATLLLFQEANPPVDALVITGAVGEVLVAVERREGVPQLLAPEAMRMPGGGRLRGVWPLGGGREVVQLEAMLDPEALLALAAPQPNGGAADPGLRLYADPVAVPPQVEGELAARVPVADDAWTPPVAWTLVRSGDESRLLSSLESLAGRYRATVALNLAVITLTLVLGTLALVQVRRAARLEAEAEQQARVRELERQVLHGERLASVGRLAAGIAHEINNPLEGMANYLRLVEDDLAAGRPDEARALLPRVAEGLDRAAAVTRQVLTFSDPGKATKGRVELTEILAETVEFVAAAPAYRELAVRFEPPQEALTVEGNPVTLGQLFLNLLLNACQAQVAQTGATEAGATAGAGAGEVEVTARRRGGEAVIAVRDRGPGIAPEALDHLFEPFYSTRGSSGLGLAVCRGIVRDHGGSIRGANRPRGGAEFEVRLPLVPRAAAAATSADEPAAAESAANAEPALPERTVGARE